jgi:hypothetical protein
MPIPAFAPVEGPLFEPELVSVVEVGVEVGEVVAEAPTAVAPTVEDIDV